MTFLSILEFALGAWGIISAFAIPILLLLIWLNLRKQTKLAGSYYK